MTKDLHDRIEKLMGRLGENNTRLSADAFSLIEDLVFEIKELQEYIDQREPDPNEDI